MAEPTNVFELPGWYDASPEDQELVFNDQFNSIAAKDADYQKASDQGKANIKAAYQQLMEKNALANPNNPAIAQAQADQYKTDNQGFFANVWDKVVRSHQQAADVAPHVADAVNPDGTVAADFGAWGAKYLQKQQAAPRTYEDKKLNSDLTQRIKAWNDGGPTEKVQAAFGMLGDILTNPKAAMYAGADSASSITAMLLGAKTGGLVGSAAGPVGTAVGTVVGTVGASASHSAALKFMELVQKDLDTNKIPYTASNIQSWMESNPDRIKELQLKSTKYGFSMGVADAAFGAVGGKVATTFERAALRQANASALAPAGKAAISGIIKDTGASVEDATQAYIQSQARNTLAAQTFKSKIGHKTAGVGTEVISEPATEAVGTLAAGEELSAKELIMEAVGGVGAGPYGAAVNTSIFGTKVATDKTTAFAKKILASTPESRAAEKEQKAEIKAAVLQRQSPAHFKKEVEATDPTDPKVNDWADPTHKDYNPEKAVTVLAKTTEPDSTVVDKARDIQKAYLDNLNKDYDKYDELNAQFEAVKGKDKAAEINLEKQLINQQKLLDEKKRVFDQIGAQVTVLKNAALEVGKDKPVTTKIDDPATATLDEITDHITQSFGSRDTTSDEQINELLKRPDLSAEQKAVLNAMAGSNAIRKVITDRATSGKTMDQVSADIYHGSKTTKGIDSYRVGIREALTVGNDVQLKKELDSLKAFRDAHVLKDKNVTNILATMKEKGVNGLSPEQAATYRQLQRENPNFNLHPVTSVGMAANIKREAAALNAEVKLAESLIAAHKTKGKATASPKPSSTPTANPAAQIITPVVTPNTEGGTTNAKVQEVRVGRKEEVATDGATPVAPKVVSKPTKFSPKSKKETVTIPGSDGNYDIEARRLPVDGFEDYDFYVHQDEHGWSVVEGSTGSRVSSYVKSQELAVKDTIEKLSRDGKAGLAKAVDKRKAELVVEKERRDAENKSVEPVPQVDEVKVTESVVINESTTEETSDSLDLLDEIEAAHIKALADLDLEIQEAEAILKCFSSK